MKKIYYLFFSAIALFISCVTPYQSTDYTGGYDETQLAENLFSVVFKGNGYTSFERTTNYCLLRCAELAKKNGYGYFVIVENKERVSHSTYTAPTNYNTSGGVNSIGNTTYGNFNTTTSGGQTYNIAKPSVNNTIKCFKEKPSNYEIVYESDYIIKSIKSKYQIAETYFLPETKSIDSIKNGIFLDTNEEVFINNLINSKDYYSMKYLSRESVKLNDIVVFKTNFGVTIFSKVVDVTIPKFIKIKYYSPAHSVLYEEVRWKELIKIVPRNSK